MKVSLLFSAALSTLVCALPAVQDQITFSGVGQSALDWTAQTISKVGSNDDGGVHAMTRWDWSDCGKLNYLVPSLARNR